MERRTEREPYGHTLLQQADPVGVHTGPFARFRTKTRVQKKREFVDCEHSVRGRHTRGLCLFGILGYISSGLVFGKAHGRDASFVTQRT